MNIMGGMRKIKKVKRLSELTSLAAKDYDNMPEDKKAEMFKILEEFGYKKAALEKLGEKFGDKVIEDIKKG